MCSIYIIIDVSIIDLLVISVSLCRVIVNHGLCSQTIWLKIFIVCLWVFLTWLFLGVYVKSLRALLPISSLEFNCIEYCRHYRDDARSAWYIATSFEYYCSKIVGKLLLNNCSSEIHEPRFQFVVCVCVCVFKRIVRLPLKNMFCGWDFTFTWKERKMK